MTWVLTQPINSVSPPYSRLLNTMLTIYRPWKQNIFHNESLLFLLTVTITRQWVAAWSVIYTFMLTVNITQQPVAAWSVTYTFMLTVNITRQWVAAWWYYRAICQYKNKHTTNSTFYSNIKFKITVIYISNIPIKHAIKQGS